MAAAHSWATLSSENCFRRARCQAHVARWGWGTLGLLIRGFASSSRTDEPRNRWNFGNSTDMPAGAGAGARESIKRDRLLVQHFTPQLRLMGWRNCMEPIPWGGPSDSSYTTTAHASAPSPLPSQIQILPPSPSNIPTHTPAVALHGTVATLHSLSMKMWEGPGRAKDSCLEAEQSKMPWQECRV